MNASDAVVEPFFLDGGSGRLFCLFFGPARGIAPRGAVLLVPPFAEEMNKARRQLVLLARALAQAGHEVLLTDLFGTGDSDGDFADADWDKWLADVKDGARWLRRRGAGPLTFVGLRLGALLAADLARHEPPRGLVFWQPVTSGKQHMDQFLRLRVASSLIAGGGVTVRALRESLTRGAALEVGGYELRPALVAAIDSLDLAKLEPSPAVRVDWLEVAPAVDRGLGPASERVVGAWKAHSVDVRTAVIAGEQFWTTVEIVVVPALIEQTVRSVAGSA